MVDYEGVNVALEQDIIEYRVNEACALLEIETSAHFDGLFELRMIHNQVELAD